MSQGKQIQHIYVGRRAEESEGLENNWEMLDINNLDLSHGRFVLFFGGNTTNRLEAANGNVKLIKSVVNPEYQSKANFYSFGYVSEPYSSDGYLSKEYINEAVMLYKKHFEPLLFDENGYMKEKKGIEKLFNKLIFGAHCGGSAFVNIIMNGFYESLLKKYPQKTAELLVSKIKYFAYAPNEILDYNANSFVVLPYEDNGFSFIKALELAENEKVDVDYPKGVVKKLIKAKQQGTLRAAFNEVLAETRAIMFKIGNSTYMIPSQMNPNKNIGDHSLECMAKPKFLNSGADCENTAKLVNFAARTCMDDFFEASVVDNKRLFVVVSERIKATPTEQKAL